MLGNLVAVKTSYFFFGFPGIGIDPFTVANFIPSIG